MDAWQELAQLIRKGRSFSGKERNCAFLNTRATRFADVSAASGLDHIDDSRTVALSDWDRDGDVDLWIASRTSPRVRLLRNDAAPRGRFVALRLLGDPARGTNRDAIGARVEIELAGVEPAKRAKTLVAGDGYLSQSTKWLYFGTGEAEGVESVVVRWPGSVRRETFTGVAIGSRHRLREGTGVAEAVEPNQPPSPLASSTPKGAPLTDAARIRLSDRPKVDGAYESFDGREISLANLPARPTLLLLWATWCSPCAVELRALAGAAKELEAAGIALLALNVDGLREPTDPAKPRAMLARLGVEFAAGIGPKALVETLDGLQQAAIYRERQLPLPSSFLLDAERRLAVVYKGAVEKDQILADAKTLAASGKELRDLSVPFPGIWAGDAFVSNVISLARTYLEGEYPEDARAILEQFLAEDPGPPSAASPEGTARNRRLADVHHLLGQIAVRGGDHLAAASSFRAALSYHPQLVPAVIDLGGALEASGDRAAAVAHLRTTLEKYGGQPDVHYALGGVLRRSGDARAAIAEYESALRLRADLHRAANDLAWLLATHPDAAIRDGRAAVRHAETAASATRYSSAGPLDTLGAAYAEAGDFAAALRFARRALAIAEQRSGDALAETVRDRIAGYEANRPHREPLAAE